MRRIKLLVLFFMLTVGALNFSCANERSLEDKVKDAKIKVIYPEIKKISKQIVFKSNFQDSLLKKIAEIQEELESYNQQISNNEDDLKLYYSQLNNAFIVLKNNNLSKPSEYDYKEDITGLIFSVSQKRDDKKEFVLNLKQKKQDKKNNNFNFIDKRIYTQFIEMFYSKRFGSVFLYVTGKKYQLKLNKGDKKRIQPYLNKKGMTLVMYNVKRNFFSFQKPKK